MQDNLQEINHKTAEHLNCYSKKHVLKCYICVLKNIAFKKIV